MLARLLKQSIPEATWNTLFHFPDFIRAVISKYWWKLESSGECSQNMRPVLFLEVSYQVWDGAWAYAPRESTPGDSCVQFRQSIWRLCLVSRSTFLVQYNTVFSFFLKKIIFKHRKYQILHRNPNFKLLMKNPLAAVGRSWVMTPSFRKHKSCPVQNKVHYLLCPLPVGFSPNCLWPISNKCGKQEFGLFTLFMTQSYLSYLYFILPRFLNFKLFYVCILYF